MEHKEKISVKLENRSQMDKLYLNILSDLETVQKAKKMLGYDCFTDDSNRRIELIESLETLYKFCDTVEDFNEALQKLFDSAQCDKAAKRLRAYITINIKQLEKEGEDAED